MRALVVEDYGPLREAVTECLRDEGFAVDSSSNGTDGLWRAESFSYDVVVLDIMLPGLDGLSVISRLRNHGNDVHIIITSARDSVAQRTEGLSYGADDYLIKPFALEELIARVQALVRRRYEKKNPIIRIDDLELDTLKQRVTRGRSEIKLTAREYGLLSYLAHRRGHVVSRTEIWEHVYEDYSGGSSNGVDVYIGYLRKKLNANGRTNLIHARRGLGYILDTP